MADLALRFNRDMLVISSPMLPALASRGIDVAKDVENVILFEEDTLADIYRIESATGAQCLVTATAGITPARLAHAQMREAGADIARAAVSAARRCAPQHLLAEIGPCGLPFDPTSRTSLKEHADQFSRAARSFAGLELDGFLLSAFADADELKCAIMGIRSVSALPLLASVRVDDNGNVRRSGQPIEHAVSMMCEYEADVVGFSSCAPEHVVGAIAQRAAAACAVPIMAEIEIAPAKGRRSRWDAAEGYGAPDSMMPAARTLHAAGAQFLRASGAATPAYTATLAAMVSGAEVVL